MKVYTLNYKDEQGVEKEARITETDSNEALSNDYKELMRRFSNLVTFRRLKTKEGEALHLEGTLKAPSHYLTSNTDTNPKPCSSMVFHIICYPGYPLKGVTAYYDSNHYLASPNVFRSGNACIDTWVPFTSSMITVADKLLRDMIHDPEVTRYESMANSDMKQWHMKGVEEGRFPTIEPKLLYASELPAMPARRTETKTKVTGRSLPALPRRRR